MGSECFAFECDLDLDLDEEWYLKGDRDLVRDLFLCFFLFFSFSSSLGGSLLLLEGLSACLTSKVGKVLTAVTGHGILLTLWN